MVKSTHIVSERGTMSTTPSTHLYTLLDRSGSMASIVNDVIGGFNTFIKQQKAEGTDIRVTLVQFDSADPQDVVASGTPIEELVPLTIDTYSPRGGTPLLDATGQLIARAKLNQEVRASNNLPEEDIIFVTITDGEENESSQFNLVQIRNLIAECEAKGWTFVFLSAALDAYGDATGMGMKSGNIQSFDASSDGTAMAFTSLSMNVAQKRKMKRAGLDTADIDFFETKIAEEDRNRKNDN
jgi:hypothetical protein